MSLEITCPLPVEIPDISAVDCEEHFGQIVRISFARAGETIFADETAFATEVAWDTALAAANSTKAQLTPLFNNFVIPEGTPVTIGPDTNETLFGELKVVGGSSIACTGRFQGLPFDVKDEMVNYISEGATFGSLGVFLINEFGKAFGLQPAGAGQPVQAIPTSSFYIGDVGSEGFNTLNYTPFSYNFKSGWTTGIVSTVPDFDLITKSNV